MVEFVLPPKPHIDEAQIEAMASPKIMARGRDYYYQGAVRNLIQRGFTITAKVEGQAPDPYLVTVELDEAGEVTWAECTCPYWESTCKHVVAVLLTLAHQPDRVEIRPSLESLLAGHSAEELQEVILDLAQAHPDIVDTLERLLTRQHAQTPPTAGSAPAGEASRRPILPLNQVVLEKQIYRALQDQFEGGQNEGYYYDVYDAIDVTAVLGPYLAEIETMLDAGQVRVARQSVRALVEALEGAIAQLPGWLAEHVEYAFEGMDPAYALDETVAEVILSECLEAKDAEEEAAIRAEWQAWLEEEKLPYLGLEMAEYAAKQGWHTPGVQAVLGGEITEKGLWSDAAEIPYVADDLAQIRLRVLARAGRWEEYIHVATAEGQHAALPYALVHLGRIQEALAEAEENFTEARQWRELIEHLWAAGARTEAIETAEAVLAKTAHDPAAISAWVDPDLEAIADWLVERVNEPGDPARALQVAILAFKATIRLADYQRVRKLAGEDWPQIRRDLLQHLDKAPAEKAIPIYLEAGLVDRAIQAFDRERHKGRYLSPSLMEAIAAQARTSHPHWVIQQYLYQAMAIIQAGHSKNYDEAVEWLARARSIYLEQGDMTGWRAFLEDLVAQHGRKYKLMNLLRKRFPGEVP